MKSANGAERGRERGPDSAVPSCDVSVIVPVYNTMPYLTRCLDSLAGQSIGHARMEVIAVDDGSTDGSEKELERYASLYPGLFKVSHQPNSGGPASPCNRGLDSAVGRYVFFLGADDHLGPEALERMVDSADTNASDVVYVKMVGVGGRKVADAVFARTRAEVPLSDWRLCWALSNTKLFRRSLVAEHGLRFPEDVSILEDQPFTLEALFRARRISVLADYDYYFSVRREDLSNLTLSSPPLERLRGLRAAMAVTERFTEPGSACRTNMNVRHFHVEAEEMLRSGFLDLQESVQKQVVEGLGALLERYFDEAVERRLEVRRRVRLAHVRAGDVAGLRAAIAHEDDKGRVPFTARGDRVYADYPAFRDPERSLPDSVFDVTRTIAQRAAGQCLEIRSLAAEGKRWGPLILRMRALSSLENLAELAGQRVASVAVDEAPARTRIALRRPADGVGTEIDVEIPWTARKSEHTLVLRVRMAGVERTALVADGAGLMPPRRRWIRCRPCTVVARSDAKGRLVVSAAPIRLRSAAARRLRRLIRG
ncbi:glycosyltransferase family 2 protein [Streptomyces sp. NPDC002577]